MRTVTERFLGRLATAAEGDYRLVGGKRKEIPLGIGERKRAFDDKRTVGSQANVNVGHIKPRSLLRAPS